MFNMIDYVKWRGDVTFEASELNHIDSLIFTELSYIPFEKILSSNKQGDTLEVLCKKFLQLPEKERKMGAIIPEKSITALFEEAAKSERFKNIRVKNYVNNVCKKAEKQFCAMTFVINKDYYYVAYRGTDDNIVAWKEDFNMAFNTPIPSQKEGAEYLNSVGMKTKRKLYIGGHSKGGNLAVYSAFFANDRVKKKILSVHNFDGPGFRPEFIDKINDEELKKITTQFIPQASIIGVIFENIGEQKYVKSLGKGMYQHDAFNWSVLGSDFVYTETLAKSSIDFHELLLMWSGSMERNEREEFVGALFKLITINDVSTLSDIASGKVKFILGLFKADSQTKKVLYSAIKKLFNEKKTLDKTKISKNVKEKDKTNPKKLNK